jgi:D-proline reductase (dithiol) PrdB
MTTPIDSFRFLDLVTKQVAKTWIANEPERHIPWTPLQKPLSECTVALISTGGIALRTDTPFDQEGERQNPWWGDPTHRVVPNTATTEEVEIYHLHIDPGFGGRDLNCIFPLQLLSDLAQEGEIGASAPSHYSFMGYQLDPTVLLERTTPEMIAGLMSDAVDLVLLVPI